MAMITRNHYFTVDMDKPLTRQACGMLLAEGDTNGDCIYFTMMRNGHELSVSGATATAYFIRQDGNTVLFSGICTTNQIRVTLPQSCYNKEGCFSLAVKVVQDGVTATIAVLDGYIKRTNTDYMIDPEETIPSVDAIIAKIEELERVTEEAKEAANAVNTVTAQVEQNTSDIKALQQQDETFVEGFMTVANNCNELSNRITALEENGGGSGTGGGTGEDGFSPIVTVTEITGGHRVTIQDAVQTQSFDVMDGEDGADGVGIAKIEQTTTSNADNGINIMTITMTDGNTYTFQVKNGSQGSAGSGESGGTGADGEDGVGIASVVQTTTSTADGGTNVITVTLTDGSKSTFNVKNGSKGSDGAAGPAGSDGFSPIVTVLNVDGGHQVSIEDENGTKNFLVKNGVNGQDGETPTITTSDATGKQYVTFKTSSQQEMFTISSPVVSVNEITGGHRVTITDVFGPHKFDVMDGEDGSAASVTIDDTLTISGAAAGAKAVGDAIEELRKELTPSVASLNQWDYGTTDVGMLTVDGSLSTANTDSVTTDYIQVLPGEKLYFYQVLWGSFGVMTPSSNNNSFLCNYNANREFVLSRLYGSEISNPYTIPDGVYHIRFSFAANFFNDSERKYGIFKREITADEFDEYIDGSINNVVIDNTLTISGAAADAKIVGNKISQINQKLVGNRLVSVAVDIDNKFINVNSNMYDNTGYALFTPISMSVGDVLRFTACGYEQNVAVLSILSADGSAYTPVVTSVDSTFREYEHTALVAGKYVICSAKGYNMSCILECSRLDNIEIDIDEIEKRMNDAGVGNDIFAFLKAGIIGDSLANGVIDYTDDSGNVIGSHARPQYSWGKYLERKHGIPVTLFCQGGATTRAWLSSSYGLTAMQSAEMCDCYIIGLGVNDFISLGDDYLGTLSDVTVGGESGNADTFYGNYSKIIAKLLAKSPRCKIFCLTMPVKWSDTAMAFNAAIRDIVALYTNAHVIDLEDDAYYRGIEYSTLYDGNHSTAAGYMAMANHLWVRFNRYMQANLADFKDIQWILEDHD